MDREAAVASTELRLDTGGPATVGVPIPQPNASASPAKKVREKKKGADNLMGKEGARDSQLGTQVGKRIGARHLLWLKNNWVLVALIIFQCVLELDITGVVSCYLLLVPVIS